MCYVCLGTKQVRIGWLYSSLTQGALFAYYAYLCNCASSYSWQKQCKNKQCEGKSRFEGIKLASYIKRNQMLKVHLPILIIKSSLERACHIYIHMYNPYTDKHGVPQSRLAIYKHVQSSLHRQTWSALEQACYIYICTIPYKDKHGVNQSRIATYAHACTIPYT